MEKFYDRQVFPYKQKINKHKVFSKEWLSTNRSKQYDFIYIDGDHAPDEFTSDAELCWDLLKIGGVMAIDDYEWHHPMGSHLDPKDAIDKFLQNHACKILIKNWQVWIRKTSV